MPPETLTCPYCNAYVPVPDSAAAGSRVACPRCGETFPLVVTGAAQAESPPSAVTPATAARPVAGNFRVAAGVVVVMTAMAGAALAFALLTREDRRAHDAAPAPDETHPANPDDPIPVPNVTPLPPVRYAGLGYLPSRTDVVLGVRLSELVDVPSGREFADSPVRVLGADLRLSGLEPAVGLRPATIDHVVLGLPSESPLGGVLVVRTRQPYDAAAVATALKAKPLPGKPAERTVYGFEVKGNLPLSPAVWFADELTFVIAAPGTLAELPRTPAVGTENLPASVREVLRDRVHDGGPVWLAGHVADWGKTPLAGQGKWLHGLNTFAAWVRPDGSRWSIAAVAHCPDEAAAAALEAEVRDRPAGWDGKTVRDGEWVTLQRKAGTDTLRGLLRP